MNYLEREHFEHWLSQQPDTRRWDYVDNDGCAVCAFLKEWHDMPKASVAPLYYRPHGDSQCFELPEWAYNALETVVPRAERVIGEPAWIYARDLKAALGLSQQEPTTKQAITTI